MATRSPSLFDALRAAVPSPESDAELLARYTTSRDDTAFSALVNRYARLVWRVARTRCRTHTAAEDVLQAAFVQLARKASSIRAGSALPGWLHRTAHRLAVKAAAKDRPTPPLPTDIPVTLDPLDALSAREMLAAVDDELANLSDSERSVLVLCGVDSLSLNEAAVRLGCSVGSVKGRLERARAKLRTRLDARGLTLPAVAGLVLGPTANAVQAASIAATGGTLRPAVASLLAQAFGMKGTLTKAAIALTLVGAVAVIGGWGGPTDPAPRASAAPVPKPTASAVVWSEPFKVDWKASGVERLGGVWVLDGKTVAVPGNTLDEKDKPRSGGVELRDADTGKVIKSLTIPNGKKELSFQVATLAASADGKSVYAGGSLFALGGKGEPVRGVFGWADVESGDGREVFKSTGPTDAPLALTPDGKQLAVIDDGKLTVRETATDKMLWSNGLGGGKRGRPTALVFNPAEKAYHVATDDGRWDAIAAATGKTLFGVSNLELTARAAAVSPDGEQTAFGGAGREKGPVVVVGKKFPSLILPEKVAVNGLAFTPDNKHLAAACSDGAVRVFEVEKGKMLAEAKEHKGEVFAVAYSPNGKKLLSVGRDAVKVWDVVALMNVK